MSLARTLGVHNAFVVNRYGPITVSGHTIAHNEFFRLNENVDVTHYPGQPQVLISRIEIARNNQMLRVDVPLPLFGHWPHSEALLTDVRIAVRLNRATVTINGVQRTINVFQVQNRAARVVRRDAANPIDLPIGTYIGIVDAATMGATLRQFWFVSARTLLVGGIHRWVPLYPQYSWGGQLRDDGFIDTGLFIGNRPNTLTIRTNLSTV